MLKSTFFAARFPAPVSQMSLEGSPQSWPALGMDLAERQDRALLLARGSWAEEAHTAKLWIREDIFCTAEALAGFVDIAKEASGPVCWQTKGRVRLLVDEIVMGDTGPWLVWLPQGGPLTDEDLLQVQPITIETSHQLVSMPVPRSQFGCDLIELPLTDLVVLPTNHWLQLLWANLLGLGPYLWRELAGRNVVSVVWNLFWAIIKARSIKPFRIGAQLLRRGKKVDIHPSAVVEGCWIGDGVRIGAHAVVRGCVLGDEVEIEDLALVEFSVLSTGAKVQRQGMVKFSVLQCDAAEAGVMQLSVLDRGAVLKRGAYLMDMNFGGEGAKVLKEGKLWPAPMGLAGGCVGAETTIGLGVQVAAGRRVPAGLQVVADPAMMLRKIPSVAEGLMIVHNGELKKP